MSEVVDHLAELTGFRDRDVLDVTLVSAFRDLLRPGQRESWRVVVRGADEGILAAGTAELIEHLRRNPA